MSRKNLKNSLAVPLFLLLIHFAIGQSAWAGSIVGWGEQVTPTSELACISAISAGEWHNLALRADGSIAGWGWNNYGQATPPPGNDFVAISAGEYHSLALKADGSIVGWGRNGEGQATPPSGNDFVAISAGEYHSLAIKEVAPPPIEVRMKLTPQALNCAGKGKFIKAHITLPEEIFPEDIDVNTPAVADPPDIDSEYIRVLGDTGPVKLEVAFSRAAFCETLTETGEIEVTVFGYLTTGQEFYATDTITIKRSEPKRKSINQAQTRRLRRHNKSLLKLERQEK